ncbi:E3 ubiquitin-protein ligase listerin [Erysiphe necator]|nr:E3 ubiquitin-protein ligase listerin [Erysiphe necator]
MKKAQFRSHASSSRAISAGFGGLAFNTTHSPLSYFAKAPDLSSIENPYVVVAFKNLTKKDESTRYRALLDLRAHLIAQAKEANGLNDHIIEAWVNLYPRLSTDFSRTIRDQAHNIQYDLLSLSQKRMSVRVSKFVGNWLAGQFDRDRTVSSNVRKAVASLLPTDEKLVAFYCRHQAAALRYACDAIQETPETLSDERTMSKEDMQAKYFIVIGSSVLLVLELLQKLDGTERSKLQENYNQFLSNDKLWKLVSCEDSGIRRIICELLDQCCQKQRHIISSNLDVISKAFISKGLSVPQQGSLSKILDTLQILTAEFPEIWELHQRSKASRKGSTKHPFTALKPYISAGPRLEPVDFWKSLKHLIKALPLKILPKNSEEFIEFLQNLQASFSGKVGMRVTARNAWECYMDIIQIIIVTLPDKDSQSNLLLKVIFPLFNKYFCNILDWDQSVENINITISSEVETEIIFKAYKLCLQYNIKENTFQDEWELLGSALIMKLKNFHSDEIKNFRLLQDLVSKLSKLWFHLLAEVIKYHSDDTNIEITEDPMFIKSVDIVKMAFEVLVNQDGKQYCAAGILQDAILLTPILFTSSPNRQKIVKELLLIHLPKLLYSPSAGLIIPIIFQLRSFSILEVKLESIWLGIIDNFLSTYKSISMEAWSEIAITLMSSTEVAATAQSHQQLQNFLIEQIKSFVLKKHSSEAVFHAALESGVLSQTSASIIRDFLINHLKNGEHELERILSVLGLINSKMHSLMNVECDIHVDLLSTLLHIKERAILEQETGHRIVKEIQELNDAIMGKDYVRSMSKLVITSLKENGISTHNLSMECLIKEANRITKKIDDPELIKLLLPITDDWYKCLYELTDHSLGDAILALPDFGSISYLINGYCKKKVPISPLAFDANGLTMPLRNAIFTLDFVFNLPCKILSIDFQLSLLELTLLTLEIMESEMELLSTNHLLSSNVFSNKMDFLDRLLHSTSKQLEFYAKNSKLFSRNPWQYSKAEYMELNMNIKISEKDPTTTIMWDLISKLVKLCEINHSISFYAGKALIRVLRILVKESNTEVDRLESWLSDLAVVNPSTQNVVGASAILIGLGKYGKSSVTIKNLCNYLVSELLSLSIDSDGLINKIILLNSCLTIYDDEDIPVAQNRLVFSVKHIISLIESVEDDFKISEVCRLLQRILPSIRDIYGSFWEKSIKICVSTWIKQKDRPFQGQKLAAMVTSLNLYSSLKKIKDPNDDLSEALVELNEQTMSHLLTLLFYERKINHKPLLVMDEILANLIFEILPDNVQNTDKYFSLLASGSFWVQSAAYVLICKCLPNTQQQLSVDVILENKDACLPVELIPLIGNAPKKFDREIWPRYFGSTYHGYPKIRCYLLAWLLTFQIFAASSYKVRGDLNNFLKSHKYIEPLLDFIFQTFSPNNENSLDLKKEKILPEKIQHYDLLTSIKADNRRNDFTWILINLYFQSLKYAPSAVKSWWLDTKKQLKNSICLWTEKFISPLLVEEELNAVISWAENQDSLDDDQNLVIKVAKNVREVSVGYEIDDMIMQFLIRVPENYPLDLVKVQSLNRVGISEQKWNSFLMTTNGVINFSNGSISDSLFVFRKNIISALKGQSECAICYSIISADRKLPDKKCGTCNNIFHSKCLFQWFKSSNQSNCPLCRNSFNY